jgi:carbon-monoxide dehydrogenase medium subunit
MRLSTPSLLVDINGLRELGHVTHRNGHIEIGALVRHAEAGQSSAVAQLAPLLAQAIPHIAHPAIRNRGTIGGSIALADPAAELPACLLALGAEIEVTGRTGQHSVPAEDFFQGLFETALAPGDVLTAIRVPISRPGDRFAFAELARRHGDYALVGLAAAVAADSGKLRDVHLAFFGVGDRPIRARRAEAAVEAGDVEAAVAALQQDLSPHSDVHASTATRRHLAGVLLRRVAAQLDSPI